MSGSDPQITVRFPSGCRWKCGSCGDCCRGHQLGPVEPEVIARLQQLGIESQWKHAADGPWFIRERSSNPEEPLYFLAKRADHCVFLQKNNLCAIHRLFGEAAKPWFCRKFPYRIVRDSIGISVIVRSECSGFPQASLTGTPIEKSISDILSHLPHTNPVDQFQPGEVRVLPDFILPLEDWNRLEIEILSTLESGGTDPYEDFISLRANLIARAGTGNTVGDTEKFRECTVKIFTALHELFNGPEALPIINEGPHSRKMVKKVQNILGCVLKNLDVRKPAFNNAAAEHMNLILRSEILAKQQYQLGGISESMGLFLVILIAAHLGHTKLPGAITVRHLQSIIPYFIRVLFIPYSQHTLRANSGTLTNLFLALTTRKTDKGHEH